MSLNSWTAVTDSTALAALPVPDGIAPGTKVRNNAVNAYFTYTISTASLVTDQVVAVAGITGARWIKDQAPFVPLGFLTCSLPHTDYSGSCALTGSAAAAKVGDQVVIIANIAGNDIDYTANFERTISVAGHIQCLTPFNLQYPAIISIMRLS